jgi:uncharacterized protein (DUF305 family)
MQWRSAVLRQPGTDMLRTLVVIATAVVFLLFGVAGGFVLALYRAAAPTSTTPGPVSVGFVQDMLARERQAVEVAATAQERTSDIAVRQLAADVATRAAAELGRTQGWLQLWGEGENPVGGPMKWMSSPVDANHGHEVVVDGDGVVGPALPSATPSHIPGFAREGEIRALRESDGPEFDVLFLQLMLRHHEAGELVLEYGSQAAEAPGVREFAVGQLDAEATEGNRMRELLALHDAGSWSP